MFDRIFSLSNVTLTNLVILLLVCCGTFIAIVYITVKNNSELINYTNKSDEILKSINGIKDKLDVIDTKIGLLTSILPNKLTQIYKK